MCTVTVIPTARGHRLCCNRDESRARPAATDALVRRAGDRAAVMPIDPTSGGTWIGVNDAGLVACLLNANPGVVRASPERWMGRRSRGVIVPRLLTCGTIEEALDSALGLDAADFPPFRLLMICEGRFAVLASDGSVCEAEQPRGLGAPLMLASSGLGDDLVEPHRRGLFDRMLRMHPPEAAQEEFHRHCWPDRPHLSVVMSRPDARTVSRTDVDVTPGSVELRHERWRDETGTVESSAARLRVQSAVAPS